MVGDITDIYINNYQKMMHDDNFSVEELSAIGFGYTKLLDLQFTRRYIRGKNVVLLDDVLTTGESFRQLQRKMKQLGALSVIGVFLGKTV